MKMLEITELRRTALVASCLLGGDGCLYGNLEVEVWFS